MSYKPYEHTASPGMNICKASKEAILISRKRNEQIFMIFNGMKMAVYPQSYFLDITEKYTLNCKIL